jgi:hypothetical protein
MVYTTVQFSEWDDDDLVEEPSALANTDDLPLLGDDVDEEDEQAEGDSTTTT